VKIGHLSQKDQPSWSSLVEGDTTLPLRFPFEQKGRSFY